ncbi:MAG: tetratricopeptide repeat protein [Bdellovibrionales bacterium]
MIKASILFFLSFTLHAQNVSNTAYIHDLEGLLNSVESRDSSRPQLTLKLADALFNEALSLSGQPMPSEKEKQKLAATRRRAISLYQDSLSGLKGLFPVPSGGIRGKIQFQMARLYSDIGDAAPAEKIWKELAAQEALPDVQRESLLRLAEVLENKAGKADLKLAESYYKKAITLCSNQDVCSYSHYRLAWVYQRQERLQEAIAEINLSLFDSKGQVREEALRDMVAFMGGMSDDGKNSLSAIEKLSARLSRPALIADLSDAYFAHGNRKAGVYVLDVVNRKVPTLKGYVRLMEEDYGFRDWQKFDTELDGAVDLHNKGASLKGDVESEKVLRRLTVQLDGERASQPKSAEAFKKTAMLYMALYPESAERNHMIDGWIAAESDDAAKIKQLHVWIGEEEAAKRTKEVIRLRKIRASIAQKTKDFNVVAEEMTALKGFATGATEKREAIYQIAYANYLNKDYVSALPKFVELAAIPAGNVTPDKWAVQGQNLALDILAQKKDYPALIAQAQTWTADARYATWLKTVKENRDEVADIKKVEAKAQFEYATSLGNTPGALKVFSQNCFEGLFLPQSCANAQVLAVKLGDQKILVEVLKHLGKHDELANELEASAEFTEAAQMLEKKLKDKGTVTRDYLKVSLLYELGGGKVNRDRILHDMLNKMSAQKTLGAEEDLILQTLKDADLITVAILKLPWKKENREFLTDYLASHGKSTPAIQAELVKSCHDTGPAWQAAALGELRRLDQKQSAMHFAGAGSKRKFEARAAALKALQEKGNCYLQSTTAQQRVVFATILARSEAGLAEEIKASPIPAGVDEEGKVQLVKALTEMAQPFADKGTELEKLALVQLDKIEDASEREALKAKVEAKDDKLFQATAATSPRQTLSVAQPQGADVLKTAIQELHQNPNQRASLTHLKSYYESNGNPRLAAYFQGRLLQLGTPEEVKQ